MTSWGEKLAANSGALAASPAGQVCSKLTFYKSQGHQFFFYLNNFVKLIKIPIDANFSEYQKDYRRRYVKRIRSYQKLEFKIQHL